MHLDTQVRMHKYNINKYMSYIHNEEGDINYNYK